MMKHAIDSGTYDACFKPVLIYVLAGILVSVSFHLIIESLKIEEKITVMKSKSFFGHFGSHFGQTI